MGPDPGLTWPEGGPKPLNCTREGCTSVLCEPSYSERRLHVLQLVTGIKNAEILTGGSGSYAFTYAKFEVTACFPM